MSQATEISGRGVEVAATGNTAEAPLRAVVPAWLVAAVVLAAIALRLWILTSQMGGADADEAVVGLMARSILHGQRPLFFWGQDYGGTLEPALVAVLFAVFGSSDIALKLVPVLLSGAAAVLVWRVGRRTVGEPSATAGGLLFLVYPPAFLWWSTKERGFYWVALVLGLAVLLVALRIRDVTQKPRVIDVVALGFFIGLAWWTTPQTMYLVVPVLGWLLVRRHVLWTKLWPAIPAAVVGALPWIRGNLTRGFPSLDEPAPAVATTYPERLGRFFGKLLPTLLGVRHAFSGDWLLGPVGVVLALVAVVALGLLLSRLAGDPIRRLALEPLLVVLAAFPFLFAIPGVSAYVTGPRYGLMLAPVLALLVAIPLATRARQICALLLATLLGAVTVAALLRLADRSPMDAELSPPRLGALEQTLDAADVDRVYADYWIAYPLTFETRGRIVGTALGSVRSVELDKLVREADPSTYVVFLDSQWDESLPTALRDGGHVYERVETGEFAVYLLTERVAPESIPSAFGA